MLCSQFYLSHDPSAYIRYPVNSCIGEECYVTLEITFIIENKTWGLQQTPHILVPSLAG